MTDQRLEQLRADALAIFEAGIRAAHPAERVRRALRFGPHGGLLVAEREISPPAALRVLAVGKAATAMAEAAISSLPPSLFPGPGIVVTHREGARSVERCRVFQSAHPVPDAVGVEAAEAVEHYVSGAQQHDGLVVLLSGGGSALLPAPAAGITLEEKIAVTQGLLSSGADIGEVNTVRKHLSRLKGGGLARQAYPAAVEALILSDVIGDDLSTIASGPTVPDPTTFLEARGVLERRGLWERLPSAVRRRLERGSSGQIPETPKAGDRAFERTAHRILGSNTLSVAACRDRATALGYRVEIASQRLCGEAREAAAFLAHERFSGGPGRRAVLAGGETTVTVRGNGRGGRNQELALAFALLRENHRSGPGEWAFLSGGTNGIDGPTDAAGALVDGGTLRRAREAGLEPASFLDNNDAYPLLERTGDLIKTGATPTNVADLQILLLADA